MHQQKEKKIMDWKKIIKDEIAEYEENLESVENLKKRIKRCEEDKRAIKSARADGTPARGGGSGIEDRWVNLITEEDLAKEQLKRINRKIAMVNRGLEKLSERDRDILRQMSVHKYGDGIPEKLCEKYAIENATLYRLWKDASKKYKSYQFGNE